MRMGLSNDAAPGLRTPFSLPISIRWLGDTPRLFAAGLPATAVNPGLPDRIAAGTTRSSIRSYAYAASVFLSFLAARRLALDEASKRDAPTRKSRGNPDGSSWPASSPSWRSGLNASGIPRFDPIRPRRWLAFVGT